jgi:hypothetical protein
MSADNQEKAQSGKRVLFNVLAFMGGTILLVVLVRYLLG